MDILCSKYESLKKYTTKILVKNYEHHILLLKSTKKHEKHRKAHTRIASHTQKETPWTSTWTWFLKPSILSAEVLRCQCRASRGGTWCWEFRKTAQVSSVQDLEVRTAASQETGWTAWDVPWGIGAESRKQVQAFQAHEGRRSHATRFFEKKVVLSTSSSLGVSRKPGRYWCERVKGKTPSLFAGAEFSAPPKCTC